MKSGFGFLNEIHPEDGLLEGEICFRISRSIGKSEIRISKSNSAMYNVHIKP